MIGLSVEGTSERLSSNELDQVVVGWAVVVTVVVLVAINLWRTFDVAFKVAALVYVVLAAGTILANLIWEDVEWQALVRATFVVLAFVLGIWAGAVGHLMVGLFGRWALAGMTVLGGFASGRLEGGLAGLALAASINYFSKRAARGDARDARVQRLAYHSVRRWGTRFLEADLADADFRGVDMNKCDLTGATIDGVQLDPDQMLPGETANHPR